MNKQSNLDLLRAVAVLLVVGGHLIAFKGNTSLRCLGALGVQIFFVHTCLVLMQSMERSGSAFVPFMIRRSFRIYPLAILMIGATILFQLPMGSLSPGHFAGFKPDAQDILANLLLVQNFSGRSAILGPSWSLAYELQMYLLLPALFVFIRSVRQALGAWLLVAISSILITSYSSTTTLANFAPCFMAGILAYHLHYRVSLKLWPAFLAAFVVIDQAIPESKYLPWIATLALGFCIPAFAQITNKPLIWLSERIAKYSYGIYLAHFVTLWLTFEKWRAPFALQLTAFIAVTGVISWTLFHLIEQPMIALGKRIADSYSAKPKFAPTDALQYRGLH